MVRSKWVVAVALALPASVFADEKTASKALEKMGAEVMHVGLDNAKPVFHVDFSMNHNFSDSDLMKALPHLKELPDLRRVTIGFTKVTDKGVAYLKELKNLEEISMPGTKVTDTGLKQLKGLKKLQSVNVIMTKVTEKGEQDLKKALPKVEVTRKIGTGKP